MICIMLAIGTGAIFHNQSVTYSTPYFMIACIMGLVFFGLKATFILLFVTFLIQQAYTFYRPFNSSIHQQLIIITAPVLSLVLFYIVHSFKKYLLGLVATLRIQNVELRRAEQSAREATRAKSDFLATMSHELRTPLNGILGNLELLRLQIRDPEQNKIAETIQQSGRLLLALVSDILDLSRIEAGKMEIRNTPFQFQNLVREVLQGFEHAAAEKGLELYSTLAPQIPPVVAGDAVRIRQILYNLISNAVKFTHRGYVKLEAQALEIDDQMANILISVTDSGIGIDADKTALLFQDFQQIDMSSNRRYQGSGLGLSICKNLVGLMGGEIGVQSAKNRGSTFWIKIQLPIGNPGDLMAAADNSGLTQQIQNAYSYRLLIVEDHPVNRKLTLAMLTHLGFVHVDCAEDGLIAVNLTREKKYDLILMDVLMPELDGVEATRSIRLGADGSKNQNTPIVALTADDIKEDLDLCLNVGMNDVLTKPVDLEQLAAMLLKWIPDLQ